jgi:hypothetical protein
MPTSPKDQLKGLKFLVGWQGAIADPRSPAGGSGPGYSKSANPFGVDSDLILLLGGLHPAAPTNKTQSSSSTVDKGITYPFGPLAALTQSKRNMLLHQINPSTDTGIYHNDGYIYPVTLQPKPKDAFPPEQQCAVLVQALYPGLGKAGEWAPSFNLPNPAPGVTASMLYYLPFGTPIATFNGQSYPADGIMDHSDKMKNSESKYAHSAIFLSFVYNKSGITGFSILEQYAGQPARIWSRRFPTNYIYSVITK